jgi:FkbM family methyltransferase
MHEPKIIYDFGANNGDDIPYYLQKADRVIAVEANPDLVSQIMLRFPQEIATEKLIVENCVLTVGSGGAVPFYVHKSDDVLSQFPEPDKSVIGQFKIVMIPSKNVVSLINQHGAPFYIKTDLEGYDDAILIELFKNEIRPKFISAESHTIDIFAILVAVGRYASFNLVDGETVSSKYANHPIVTQNGISMFSFPYHSAGPYGEDIKGPWMTKDNFFRQLAFERLGWKDIHATTEIAADPTAMARKVRSMRQEATWEIKDRIRRYAPPLFEALKKIRRTFR